METQDASYRGTHNRSITPSYTLVGIDAGAFQAQHDGSYPTPQAWPWRLTRSWPTSVPIPKRVVNCGHAGPDDTRLYEPLLDGPLTQPRTIHLERANPAPKPAHTRARTPLSARHRLRYDHPTPKRSVLADSGEAT